MLNDIPVELTRPMAAPSWLSLFSKMPSNAGVHSLCSFENAELDGAVIPPTEVIEVGVGYWKVYLVGFS